MDTVESGAVESWVGESQRRGERIVVIIRNDRTGEEVETTISPLFIATLTGTLFTIIKSR